MRYYDGAVWSIPKILSKGLDTVVGRGDVPTTSIKLLVKLLMPSGGSKHAVVRFFTKRATVAMYMIFDFSDFLSSGN